MSTVPVFIGRWQDRSQSSSVMGDVLTLDVQRAGYLIAALSTFVSIVGSAAFGLIALVIHQLLIKNEPSDALAVQFRVLFRNPSSPTSITSDVIRLWWAWNRLSDRNARVKRLKIRCFLLTLPPLVVYAGFIAAGVFVSNVAGDSYTSNNVLVSPVNCGLFIYDSTPDGIRAGQQKNINDTLAGRAYVDNCYRQNSNVAQCSLFPTQAIPYSTTQVPCPFGTDSLGNSLCVYNQSQAFQVDTGLLDTNDILGINAAPQNRILFRKRLTCSPINVTSYIETDNSTNPTQLLNIGPIYGVSDFTYRYNTLLKEAGVGYLVLSIPAGAGVYTPIQPLQVSDGDMSAVILISNSIRYLAPVEDLWFSATTPLDPGSGLQTEYVADADIAVMGCVDRLQICNPSTNPSNCTIVSNWDDVQSAYNNIGLNDYQIATAGRSIILLGGTATFNAIDALGDNALYARRNVYEGISTGLLANQWQAEVIGWFETSLAKLQAAVIEEVAKTADLSPYGQLVTPNQHGNPIEQASASFCNNQRVRNTGGYQTFSFLGLMIVICVGVIIILLSLEPIFKFIRRCVSACACARVSEKDDGINVVRTADGILQLLKMALWGAGYDKGWERWDKDKPVTTAGSIFELPIHLTDKDGIQTCGYERKQESQSSEQSEHIVEDGGGESLALQQNEGRVENGVVESTYIVPNNGNGNVLEGRETGSDEDEGGVEGEADNMNASMIGGANNQTTNQDTGEVTHDGRGNVPANNDV